MYNIIMNKLKLATSNDVMNEVNSELPEFEIIEREEKSWFEKALDELDAIEDEKSPE
jgi:hypothetical protein